MADCVASARAKSSGVGDLDVAGLAGEHADFHAGPFGQRGVVGEIVAALLGGAAMRVEQGGEGEGLRRLYQAQWSAIERFFDGAVGSTRLTVSVTGSAGMAAPVFSAAAIARAIRSALANGRAASWISTMSGVRGKGLEAGAHRGLPRGAAETGGRISDTGGQRRERGRYRPCGSTGCTGDVRGRWQSPTACGGAWYRRRCAGIAWAGRRPRAGPARRRQRRLRLAAFASPQDRLPLPRLCALRETQRLSRPRMNNFLQCSTCFGSQIG